MNASTGPYEAPRRGHTKFLCAPREGPFQIGHANRTKHLFIVDLEAIA
jgi:hypothetical protein